MPVRRIAKMTFDRAPAKLKTVGADHVGARTNVILVNRSHQLRLFEQLMIGPGDVAAQNLGADRSVEHHEMPAVHFFANRRVAHRAPFPSPPKALASARM
jgi:hypothetical protein